MAVTAANVTRYVHLLAHRRLNTCIQPLAEAFLNGMTDVIEPELISNMFTGTGLSLIISGKDDSDWSVDAFERAVDIFGESQQKPKEQPQQVQWLFEHLRDCSARDRARFLLFVTGSSRAPLLGFSAMSPRFNITVGQSMSTPKDAAASNADAAADKQLPTAATCTNAFFLPRYSSKDILVERVLTATRSGAGIMDQGQRGAGAGGATAAAPPGARTADGKRLLQANTEKEQDSGAVLHGAVRWGYSAMQGKRLTMEDAHIVIDNLGGDDHLALFAVFDGHSGRGVADHAANLLPAFIDVQSAGASIPDALRRAYIDLDAQLFAQLYRNQPKEQREKSGCTALVCVVAEPDPVRGRQRRELLVANVGDSRAVLCRSATLAVPLSRDHKPTLADESERIYNTGGFVKDGRVNGRLAMSRALGDFHLKPNHTQDPQKQPVSCEPEVLRLEVEKDDEFCVFACDGIFDVMTNQQVAQFVRDRLVRLGRTPTEVSADLLDEALARGSGDNMSAFVVLLRDPAAF